MCGLQGDQVNDSEVHDLGQKLVKACQDNPDFKGSLSYNLMSAVIEGVSGGAFFSPDPCSLCSF
jgi:hypothetical protein